MVHPNMGGGARQSLKPQSFPRLDQAVFSTQSHYYLPNDVSVQFLTLAKSDQNLTLHQKKRFTLSQTKCIKRHPNPALRW